MTEEKPTMKDCVIHNHYTFIDSTAVGYICVAAVFMTFFWMAAAVDG